MVLSSKVRQMVLTQAWRVNEILYLRPNGPNGSKYTVDGKVRSLTKEFGIRRATRGRRASLHIQVKRHRHQLVSYVISHVTNINNNNNRTQIPVINGNRKITWRRDELIQRYPVRN